MRRESATPSSGLWWAPPAFGAIAFAASLFAVGIGRTHTVLFSGRDALEVALVSVGMLGSLAFGAILSALATRERTFGLFSLGVIVPWCVSLAMAHVVGQLDEASQWHRSVVAAAMAHPAIVLVAAGAGCSAGLALGSWVALVPRWRDEPGVRGSVLLLVVTMLGAGTDAVFCAFLERTLVELLGAELFASVDALRDPAASVPIARLAGLDGARQWLSLLALSCGAVVTLLVVRGSFGVRSRASMSIASVGLAAMPVASVAAQTRLAETLEHWANPAWTAIAGFDAPLLELLEVQDVEPAGVVFDDRWIDVAGVTHEDFAGLAAQLRDAADRAEAREHSRRGEDAEVTAPPDPIARGIPRPRSLGRNVLVAVDARVGAARWRTIVEAVREADVRTLCLASRTRDDDGEPVPTPERRGVAWIDALTPIPVAEACLHTEASMPTSWPVDQSEIVELRLGARAHVAARARPGSSPRVDPGVVACDENGLMRGFPDPTAIVTLAEGMTTASFAALPDADSWRLEVQPILAWTALPDTPAPGVDDSPPAALREDPTVLSAVTPRMLRIHLDPPEVAPDQAVEVFALADLSPRRPAEEDATYTRAVERLTARGASLARCYAEERARDAASGGRVHLDIVVDVYGVPLDAACTRSIRSTAVFCACLEASVMDEAPDASTSSPPEDAPRLTLALWFQARDADRAAAASP